MVIFYDLLIRLYYAAIRIASLWNKKARLWIAGRQNIFANIQMQSMKGQETAWFHCASLGEFEQGRPLIEAFKKKYPGFKIVLTFFSPSGYEIRKNYAGADLITYLPLDTRQNARRFIELLAPAMAIFVKYEFWYHYLNTLHQNNIPVFVVSANFRSDQIFFKWYGGFNRRILKNVNHFFVQTPGSANLLKSINIDQVSVSGDTRFDRVLAIAQEKKKIPFLEEFKGVHKILIAGSTWPADHKLLLEAAPYLLPGSNMKFIVAPHEINASEINGLIQQIQSLGFSCMKYSEAGPENIKNANVLIIDSIGLLSSIYQYGDLAYIGGGFGKGIHNILEAATFGLPLFFGPAYGKFMEALDLISLGGAFPVENTHTLQSSLQTLLNDPLKMAHCSKICLNYTSEKQGATQTILNYLEKSLPHVT